MKKLITKKNIKISFSIYIILLLYILFISKWSFYKIYFADITIFSKEHFATANIIPLKTLIQYFKRLKLGTIGVSSIAKNIGGHLVLFVPMGIFFSILFPALKKKKFILLTLIASLLIETFQFIALCGIADVDDIILNFIGAIISYTLCTNRQFKI